MEVRKKVLIGKKNAPQYFGKTFGSYLVLPELKQGTSGEWLIKIRCLECGEERFFKPGHLWKRGKCTCDVDRRRTAHVRGVPSPRRKVKVKPFDDLTEIWPKVIKAGWDAMENKK